MVDGPLLNLIARLQRRHGMAWSGEGSWRGMVWEDSGHMPGVMTVPRALWRLQESGVVVRFWLQPGGLLPDGSPCTHGCTLVYLPQCRTGRQRRAVAARAAELSNRREMHRLAQARQIMASLAPPATSMGPDEWEAARRDSHRRLRELAAAWSDGEDKPPT